jgi:hypothetical protein
MRLAIFAALAALVPIAAGAHRDEIETGELE